MKDLSGTLLDNPKIRKNHQTHPHSSQDSKPRPHAPQKMIFQNTS